MSDETGAVRRKNDIIIRQEEKLNNENKKTAIHMDDSFFITPFYRRLSYNFVISSTQKI